LQTVMVADIHCAPGSFFYTENIERFLREKQHVFFIDNIKTANKSIFGKLLQ
jgi:hypothetical protein